MLRQKPLDIVTVNRGTAIIAEVAAQWLHAPQRTEPRWSNEPSQALTKAAHLVNVHTAFPDVVSITDSPAKHARFKARRYSFGVYADRPTMARSAGDVLRNRPRGVRPRACS
jgi:hypothetical protein